MFDRLATRPGMEPAWQELVGLLATAPFRAEPAATLEDEQRRTYAQLEVLDRWAGGGGRLLADPGRLFLALEFAAIVNPSLFHVAQVHYGVCLASIDLLGRRTPALQASFDELDALGAVGVILITEAGRGNSHLAVQTRATYDPATDDFLLSTPAPGARKLMPSVGLPGVPKVGLVFAQLWAGGRKGGLFPFVVPIRDAHRIMPGIRIAPLRGRSSLAMDYAEVGFCDVRVPRTHWLADDATLLDDGTLADPLGDPDRRLVRSLAVSGNASTAATVGAAACARAATWIALRYARGRLTMGRLGEGRPVLDFTTHQGLLFGALAQACAITATAHELVASMEATGIGRGPATPCAPTTSPWSSINRPAALAKAICVDGADQVLRDCRSAGGAQACLASNRFGAYAELVDAYTSAGGNNRLILMDIGMALATDAGERPAPARLPERLDGPESMRVLAMAEEGRHRARAARGLGAALAAGQEAFETWNPRLDAAIDLALSHGRRLALESLLARAALDRDGAPVIEALAAIYAIRQFGASLPDDVKDDALARASELVARHLDALLQAFDLSPFLPDVGG